MLCSLPPHLPHPGLFEARGQIFQSQDARRVFSCCLCSNELHFRVCYWQCLCDQVHINIHVITHLSVRRLLWVNCSLQCVRCVHQLARGIHYIQRVALQPLYSQWAVIERLLKQRDQRLVVSFNAYVLSWNKLVKSFTGICYAEQFFLNLCISCLCVCHWARCICNWLAVIIFL